MCIYFYNDLTNMNTLIESKLVQNKTININHTEYLSRSLSAGKYIIITQAQMSGGVSSGRIDFFVTVDSAPETPISGGYSSIPNNTNYASVSGTTYLELSTTRTTKMVSWADEGGSGHTVLSAYWCIIKLK